MASNIGTKYRDNFYEYTVVWSDEKGALVDYSGLSDNKAGDNVGGRLWFATSVMNTLKEYVPEKWAVVYKEGSYLKIWTSTFPTEAEATTNGKANWGSSFVQVILLK